MHACKGLLGYCSLLATKISHYDDYKPVLCILSTWAKRTLYHHAILLPPQAPTPCHYSFIHFLELFTHKWPPPPLFVSLRDYFWLYWDDLLVLWHICWIGKNGNGTRVIYIWSNDDSRRPYTAIVRLTIATTTDHYCYVYYYYSVFYYYSRPDVLQWLPYLCAFFGRWRYLAVFHDGTSCDQLLVGKDMCTTYYSSGVDSFPLLIYIHPDDYYIRFMLLSCSRRLFQHSTKRWHMPFLAFAEQSEVVSHFPQRTFAASFGFFFLARVSLVMSRTIIDWVRIMPSPLKQDLCIHFWRE
jgi:hypothetical protein